MIKRFLNVSDCINMALIEFGRPVIISGYLETLCEILKVLEPLELGVIELSKANCNLLVADGVFKFMFEKLDNMKSTLARSMKHTLKETMDSSRNKNMISVLYFLQNGIFPKSDVNFSYASKPVIKALTKEIFSRLFGQTIEIETAVPTDEEINIIANNINDNYIEMQKAIGSVTEVAKSQNSANKSTNLDIQFKVMESNGGTRTPALDCVYNAILSISPSSTESERVFSVSSNFITKIRSSLSGKSLHALVFLKYYFQRK